MTFIASLELHPITKANLIRWVPRLILFPRMRKSSQVHKYPNLGNSSSKSVTTKLLETLLI